MVDRAQEPIAVALHPDRFDPWQEITSLVFRIAGEIRFGRVELTIHDGRVVQLEVTERFRSPAEGQPGTPPRRRSGEPNNQSPA